MKYIPFDSRDINYKSPFGAVKEDQAVTFNVLLHEDARVHTAFLLLCLDGGQTEYLPLNATDRFDGKYHWYELSLSLKTGLYWYSFAFDSDFGRQFITRFKNGEGYVSSDGEKWQLTVYDADYKTPDCFMGGIIYQIFPDRFNRSGQPKTLVPDDRFLQFDQSATPAYLQNGGTYTLGNDYYGGDLKGITEKLDYLKSLGVSIIYLNPIFEAHSNHRYNTADYMKIDPLLGLEEDFCELCQKAEDLGISIVLDGVFSHTGDDSRYFNRHLRYSDVGAYNSTSSEYYNWFKFKSWPNSYDAWWGVPSLPETNEENPSFADFITGNSGVLKKWLTLGAKGWRLDVADELPDSLLDKIRTSVKALNPNAIIIGEVWEDASNKTSYGIRRRYLLGKQLDSVMNYPFATALIKYLTGDDASVLTDTVMDICENYPRPALRLLMNHIGTHDTARILTELGGEKTHGRDRSWQATHKMNESQLWYGKKLLYLAALIQYTLPGIPSLYYGDEAGMEGYFDPFCRGFYPWGKEDPYLVDFYKTLGNFRRQTEAFADGDFLPVVSSGGKLGYIRRNEAQEVLILVNRDSFNQEFEIDTAWDNAESVFGFASKHGKITVEGLGFAVLKKPL